MLFRINRKLIKFPLEVGAGPSDTLCEFPNRLLAKNVLLPKLIPPSRFVVVGKTESPLTYPTPVPLAVIAAPIFH